MGAPAPNPVRIGKPVIHPHAARTPAPLSGAGSGNVENRVVSFRSRTSPCSISISSAPRLSAVQTATPNRAPFSVAASASRTAKGNPERAPRPFAIGRFLTRARSAARLTASVAPRSALLISISPSNPPNSCAYGWRQPYDAPLDVRAFRPGRRRQQPLVQMRPGFRQTVAHQQHDVGAHARFARRREHDSGFAQTVEIPQHCRRMHMLDDAANSFGKRDGRPRPVDIRAEPGNERLTASRQKPSRGGGRVVQRRGRAVDRCRALGADWVFQRHTLRPIGSMSTEDRLRRLRATSGSRDLTKQISRRQVQSHRD